MFGRGGSRGRRVAARVVAPVAALAAAVFATAAIADDPAQPPIPTNLVRENVFGGASDFDWPVDVESDGADNVYFAGWTMSPDFPRKGGPLTPRAAGSQQGFVRRYAPDGSLVYSALLPLGAIDDPVGFAVADDGAVYAAGEGSSWDTHFSATSVVKLTPSGEEIEYETLLGGVDSWALPTDIAVAPDGGAFVIGTAPSFPVTSGAWSETPFPVQNNFLARLSPAGELIAATYLPFGPRAVQVSPAGDVYVAGQAHPGAFGPAPGVSSTGEEENGWDGLIARFSPDLERLVFASYVGTPGDDQIEAVDVDAGGVVHAVGSTNGDSLKQINPLELREDPGERGGDAMYVSLSPDGQAIRQLARLGGIRSADVGTDLELAPDGAVLISGHRESYAPPLHGSLPDRPNAPGFAVRIEDGAMTHLTLYGDPSVTGNSGNGGITGTSDGLVHIGDWVHDERSRPTLDLRLEALRMNPFVDEPEVTVDEEQDAAASVRVDAGAREAFDAAGRGTATIGRRDHVRTVQLRSAPADGEAYELVPLTLRALSERGRHRLRAALRSGKRIRVAAQVRFTDAQGTVAVEQRKQTVRGERR